MNTYGLLFFLAYAVVFAAVLVGVTSWDRRRRRTKQPLPENFKLLRMPGEYLWRQVVHRDETDLQWSSALWFSHCSLAPWSSRRSRGPSHLPPHLSLSFP